MVYIQHADNPKFMLRQFFKNFLNISIILNFVGLSSNAEGFSYFNQFKAKVFQETKFFIIILLTYRQAISMHVRHETSLPCTPWPFWTLIFNSGK